MQEELDALSIFPAHSLGGIYLGTSLQCVLTYVKARSNTFPAIEVQYSQAHSVSTPLVVNLPKNGMRLRFDGPEQRLRCIEVVDFARINVAYKGTALGKARESRFTTSGPTFRRVYQVFGATFPGEYVEPQHGLYVGSYILSWPGVAFAFPLQHSAWSPAKDHVALLGSQAAGEAAHMVLFEGKSWPEACAKLFTYESTFSRNLSTPNRSGEIVPGDLELVSLDVKGTTLFSRRAPWADLVLTLNGTTPQDLICELGPPDATYCRDNTATTKIEPAHKRSDSTSKHGSGKRAPSGSAPSSYSSSATDTYETDFDSDVRDEDPLERANRETFWCYFRHGLDILVAPANPSNTSTLSRNATALASNLVVTKIVIHGNIPGTYSFNRHRRLRWRLALDHGVVTSEQSFEDVIKPALLQQYKDVLPMSDMIRGKVVNRSWGTGSDDGAFFLPDASAELIEGDGSEQWLGNTRLYHFPGLVFEVADNGFVTTLSIS